jgi:signal transduction histidine kinase
MNASEFQLLGLSDPLLAVHATSALPAWLWSTDGKRVVWANPVGAGLFGAANSASLADKTFGPADSHRRQVAQLASRLPQNGAIRLERLRGFGAPLGQLMTCSCARLDFSDGSHGILIVAQAARRTLPLSERLRRLIEGVDRPIAAFSREGMLVAANDAARPLIGFRDLSEAGLEAARDDALRQGRFEAPIGIGQMVLQRVGRGADVVLVALFAPNAIPTAKVNHITPAGFEMVDEFAQGSAATADDAASEHQAVDGDADATPQAMTSEIDTPAAEPSPSIEAVDDEPTAPSSVETRSWADEPSLKAFREPLRFIWQIDADGNFLLERGEFTHLIGPRTAAGLNRRWSEIAEIFGLDPDGRVAKVMAAHDTWSGVAVSWSVDGGEALPVELAGLPVFDRMQKFAGYWGVGVCRDLDGLMRLAALRGLESSGNSPAPQRLSADIVQINAAQDLFAKDLFAQDLSATDSFAKELGRRDLAAANSPAKPDMAWLLPSELLARVAVETSPPTYLEKPVETPPNVVPFRPIGEPKSPTLTSVENNAFDELARQLSERLDGDDGIAAGPPAAIPEATSAVSSSLVEPQLPPSALEAANDQRASEHSADDHPPINHPEWLEPPEPPARGETERDLTLLDLLPTGILIYRLDRLLYANPAFLKRIGYPSLHALEEVGGLDALYVEAGVSSASSTSEAGTPVTISASQSSEPATDAEASSATEARLFTISWDGESALALICSPAPAAPSVATMAEAARAKEPARQPPAVGRANAEDLAAQSKDDRELQPARRQSDREANAKADMLARISYELRTPLNAIIDFAEVMINERFGALGNERYVEYMKDIRSSGERVIAVVNDLLELSRIETGKLDLAFADQNLNELVESCVAVMQPQANRERIIIRTSLSHALPPVMADTGALRQIALNLIGNSIHLANAGGQVIVSTALSDLGEVVLRVRDSGAGLNDNEVAAALAPFRSAPPSDEASDGSPVNLSLTKALVEANRAQFHIKTGARSGTLIEVVFSNAPARG